MKQMFRTYSHLLQLRPAAIAHYLDSHHAGRSLRLFVVIMLIAGLGTWLGVPQALRQLTLPEQVDLMAEAAGEATAQIVATVLPVLTKTENAAQVAVSTVRQQVMQVTGWVGEMAASVSQELTAGRQQIENNTLVQQLLQQSTITSAQIEEAIRQSPVTSEQLDGLLSRANLTPAQALALLRRAGVSAEQIAQVQTLQTQAGAALDQLGPLLEQLSMTERQFQEILTQLLTTPEQVVALLDKLALAPEAIGSVIDQVEATPAQLQALAAGLRAEAVRAEPPLGTRASRIVRLGGEWLSTPLHFANQWLFFGLVLLLVARLLGGRATLPKHLGAMALAAAPLVLLFGLYIPNLEGVLSIPMAGAVHYYSRVLAVVGLAWAGLVLLRSLALAHEISLWRAAGALALAFLAIYVLLPLVSIILGGYVLV